MSLPCQFIIYVQFISCFLFFSKTTTAQIRYGNSPLLYGIFNNDKTLETRIIPIYSSAKAYTQEGQTSELQISTGNEFPVSDEWYGSATLAADPRSGLFFYASKSVEQHQVWAVNQNGRQINLNQEANQLSGHSLTKMAMGPDGYVYALSTGIGNRISGKETLLIRFKACNSPGCTKIENLGYISEKDGFRNSLIYSGDMAFSSTGDLYLFGTEMDTTINYYKGAHIFRIASNSIKLPSKSKTIGIQYLGHIAGMGVKTGIDSTVVTGVAFEKDGSFILSTVDKYSGSRVHFYKGAINRSVSWVKPLELKYSIPKGFKISDLASFTMPAISVLTSKKYTGETITSPSYADNWEKNVTITKFNQ